MLKTVAASAVAICSTSLAQVSDGWYPGPIVDEFAPQKSRAQVVAELREAQRLGLVHPGGEGDIPQSTPEQERRIARAGGAPDAMSAAVSNGTKSRARVVAELREAQRLGLVNAGGESDPPQATAEQERLITLAGDFADAPTKVAEK